MRLKSFVSMMAVVGLVVGCPQQQNAAEAATSTPPRESAGGGQRAEAGNIQHPTAKGPTPTPSGGGEPAKGEKRKNDNLLFRVQFAGTTALLANTNAAYLTNFSALPETAALGTHIVARVASLPGRIIGERGMRGANGGGLNQKSEPGSQGTEGGNVQNPTSNVQPSTSKEPTPSPSAGGDLLRPVFAEMLRDGFTLELRGNNGAVTDFALAAKADSETAKNWQSAWKSAATNWPAANKLAVNYSGDWFFVAGSGTDPAAALGAIQKTAGGVELEAGAVLQGELASSLLPGPVQRSVYGGFERLKISVKPENQTLRIRGTAIYPKNLPSFSPSRIAPTNLVTKSAISFTMIRNPSAWLEPHSPLLQFFPKPVPDTLFFWGGEVSPYELTVAAPFPSREAFNNGFGPLLRDQIMALATLINSGNAVLDTNEASIKWQNIPFISPRLIVRDEADTNFLTAELFPLSNATTGLSAGLKDRVSNQSDLLVYDWEFTAMRLDTWVRVGQLAIFLSGHRQLDGVAPSIKWIQTAQLNMTGGGNTSTEITQTGPRELTLKRSAPVVFTSIELFWLANWLESANFPAANFLVPMEQ